MADEPNRSWKDQYMLRFPDGMRDLLKQHAEKNGRSLNVEIVTRLEASLAGGEAPGDAVDQIFINAMKDLSAHPSIATSGWMHVLTTGYETYKVNRIQDLREFLDRVRDVMRQAEGQGGPMLDDDMREREENWLSRLRASAHAWGYDLVDRSESKK
ncbi:Arc family DNA-binding protein [Rhizobium sp. LjRoot30]|uniref:Arc family DNA-binding protein n=1 Tax=Rhizobium sp. LjRoot30 TaxID=3342320 RepID=UPI003ECD8EA5